MKMLAWIGLVLLAAVPLTGIGNYPLHLVMVCPLWGYVYKMVGHGRLAVSRHGAFLGIGAYAVVMLWNHFGLSPWLGALAGVLASVIVALVIGIPCFRFKIVGHYFALVTLALSEVTRLIIVALRDQTGGSLGATPNTALAQGNTWSLGALQFSEKVVWFYAILGFWLAGLWVWAVVDRGMTRLALEAISQEEDAAVDRHQRHQVQALRDARLRGDDVVGACSRYQHSTRKRSRESASRCRWCSARSPAACS
jgi:branched-chain amino acid transport system permease protein